jgi:hypothetical protein
MTVSYPLSSESRTLETFREADFQKKLWMIINGFFLLWLQSRKVVERDTDWIKSFSRSLYMENRVFFRTAILFHTRHSELGDFNENVSPVF